MNGEGKGLSTAEFVRVLQGDLQEGQRVSFLGLDACQLLPVMTARNGERLNEQGWEYEVSHDVLGDPISAVGIDVLSPLAEGR